MDLNYISDAINDIKENAPNKLCGICLSPHSSRILFKSIRELRKMMGAESYVAKGIVKIHGVPVATDPKQFEDMIIYHEELSWNLKLTELKGSNKMAIQTETEFDAVIRFSGVPAHDHGGLKRWILYGVKPGHFLTAVIENDLREAYGRADEANTMAMRDIMRFFYNDAPSSCWGSPAACKEWIKIKEQERRQAECDKVIDVCGY